MVRAFLEAPYAQEHIGHHPLQAIIAEIRGQEPAHALGFMLRPEQKAAISAPSP
jgi:hypothetical protein